MAEVATDSGEPEGSRGGSMIAEPTRHGNPVAAEASSSVQSRYFTKTTSFCFSL
jgi:hypothetical protein